MSEHEQTHEHFVSAESTFIMTPTGVLTAGISDRALRTYQVLRSYVRPGHGTFPKVATVAERFGLSESYLHRGISELRKAGLLVVTKKQFAAGWREVNCYHFPNIADEPVKSDKLETVKSDSLTASKSDRLAASKSDRLLEVDETEVDEVEVSSSATADAAARPDVDALCDLMIEMLKSNGARTPSKISKQWHDAARLLIDRDGYTPKQVEWVMRWAMNDDFWRTNILSMPTLRKQFDRLKMRALAEHEQQKTAPRSSSARERRLEENDAEIGKFLEMFGEQ